MAVDICYIVSHGFASRMLLQTDLLGKLRDAGGSVALIAPDRNDPVLSEYCERRGVQLEQFEPRSGFFIDDYLFKRRYYLEDIRNNVTLWEKHLAATRYHKARNPLKRLRPYWYYLMYRLIPRFPGIRRRFARNESRRLRSADAEALLKRLRPKKLISTYPVSLAEAVLLHHGNRDPDIQTWIHLLSWDNISCKGRFPEIADRYIAWGAVMRDELREYYQVPEDRIHVCGVPHFDLHRDPQVGRMRPQVLRQLGLDPERPYLLFAMSSPRFAPHEIDIVEWLAERVGAGEFGPLQLLVRPHPQNVQGNMSDPGWLPRLQRLERRTGVSVVYPRLVKSRMRWSLENEDMLELAATLSGAAAVLNSGSTVSIDALMHGRPVIITSFDGEYRVDYWRSAVRLIDYPHLKKLVGLGGVSVVRDFVELRREVDAYLAGPDRLRRERDFAVRQQCHNRDGGATARVVEAIRHAA